MIVLGIETSTVRASVALGSEQELIASCSISRGATHGEFILPSVEYLLEKAGLSYGNIAGVAVGVGPGLFTGLRVGVATAKTLAQALSVPIVGISSLDLLAYDARYSNKVVCPVLDARRKEVFYAFYRQVPGGITRTSEYSVGRLGKLRAEIQSQAAEVLLVGHGTLLYRHELEQPRVELGSMAVAFPRADSLVELVMPRLFRGDSDRLLEIEPQYMRRSTAEINWSRRIAG